MWVCTDTAPDIDEDEQDEDEPGEEGEEASLTVGAEDASTRWKVIIAGKGADGRRKGIFFFRKETEAADVQLPLKLWIRHTVR